MAQDTRVKSDWKKTFFLIWTGQAFSIVGSMLVQFAHGLVDDRKDRFGCGPGHRDHHLHPTAVSSLGPFAGALVDRWNRKLVMIVADGATALTTLGAGAAVLLRAHSDLASLCGPIHPRAGWHLPLARHVGLHLADGARQAPLADRGNKPGDAGRAEHHRPAAGRVLDGHSRHLLRAGDRHCARP